MTESNKAKGEELIEKFANTPMGENDVDIFYLDDKDAVQCAIIAVEEIIESLQNIDERISRQTEQLVVKEINEQTEVLNYLKSKL